MLDERSVEPDFRPLPGFTQDLWSWHVRRKARFERRARFTASVLSVAVWPADDDSGERMCRLISLELHIRSTAILAGLASLRASLKGAGAATTLTVGTEATGGAEGAKCVKGAATGMSATQIESRVSSCGVDVRRRLGRLGLFHRRDGEVFEGVAASIEPPKCEPVLLPSDFSGQTPFVGGLSRTPSASSALFTHLGR